MQTDDFYNILCFLVLFCQLPGSNSLTPLQDSMGKAIYIFRRDCVPRILQQLCLMRCNSLCVHFSQLRQFFNRCGCSGLDRRF